MKLIVVLGVLTFTSAHALEPIKLVVWKKAETIQGNEFIAANSAVVDYLSTLRRPTGIPRSIVYNCQGKLRWSRLSINTTGSQNFAAWADVATVYDLGDCVESR